MAGLVNFEDEKEVKLFLDNLGVEYSFQCYSDKDPQGCQRLADYLDGVKKHLDSAAQVLKHNCDDNKHGESCYKLGCYHITGKGGVSKSLDMAHSRFLFACKSGGKRSIDACHNMGVLACDGSTMGGEPDFKAAQDYYEKACAGGFAPSCFNLSNMFIQGKSTGSKPDMKAALQYASRACELGHMWGCHNASRMYRLGDGTEKDKKKADELKKKAEELQGLIKERQLKFGE